MLRSIERLVGHFDEEPRSREPSRERPGLLNPRVEERLEVPIALPPYLDSVDLRDSNVLIADDVADTGATLAYVHDFCQGEVADVRSAVLYEKSASIIKCEYVWKRTDLWINFPWSTEPPIVDPREGQIVLDA